MNRNTEDNIGGNARLRSNDTRRKLRVMLPTRTAVWLLTVGLSLWLAGLLIWLIGHALAVWVTRKDPAFLTVLSRHARHKGALSC